MLVWKRKEEEGAIKSCVGLSLACSPVTGSTPVTWGHLLRGSCVSGTMLEGLPWYGTTEPSVRLSL